MILALLALTGCRSSSSNLAATADGYVDTVIVAREAGHHYRSIVEGCVAKVPDSMHAFFWLTAFAGFDASSTQGHAGVSADLLRHLGDQFFGECLAREKADIQNRVREDLLYDLGYGNTDITLASIKKRYPITFPKGWTDNN